MADEIAEAMFKSEEELENKSENPHGIQSGCSESG